MKYIEICTSYENLSEPQSMLTEMFASAGSPNGDCPPLKGFPYRFPGENDVADGTGTEISHDYPRDVVLVLFSHGG